VEWKRETPDKSVIDRMAFDYAWNYFSLHSGQRMQSLNFFLIAAAFLASSYVTAIVGGHPLIAAGLSLLGAFSSLVYRIERRVRGLIHAAEGAP
jgi:Flp pilus assembly protein TadB